MCTAANSLPPYKVPNHSNEKSVSEGARKKGLKNIFTFPSTLLSFECDPSRFAVNINYFASAKDCGWNSKLFSLHVTCVEIEAGARSKLKDTLKFFIVYCTNSTTWKLHLTFNRIVNHRTEASAGMNFVQYFLHHRNGQTFLSLRVDRLWLVITRRNFALSWKKV